MSKSKKSRLPAPRRPLRIESLEGRALFAADLPLAVNDLFDVPADQPFTSEAPGVFANDSAAEGATLSAELFSGPAHGTLDLRQDGSFDYVPEAGFRGLDSFVYLASDGVATSGLAAVSLNVEPVQSPPVAVNDAYSVNEDESLAITAELGILANDSDADGDEMAASLVSGPRHGTLDLAEDGSFTYTPEAGFHGIDGFSYQTLDAEGESHVATATITVTSVNDAPVANNDEFTIDEDSPLEIALPGLLANDTDLDGDALTAVLEEGPANGTVTLNADGSFTYTPNANFNGVDGFTYVASDGAAESDVAAVTINVNSANDAPVANNDEFTTDEDSPLVIELPGLLANDSDADGDTLTAVLESGPLNGSVTMNADGSFSYTPNADFSGVDGFTYVVSDGTVESDVAAVTINVNAVNDAPVANHDEYATDEDTQLIIDAAGVLANDTDVEGDSLVATMVTGPENGSVTLNSDGSFSYTPNADFSGIDSFTYTAGDGSAESEIATVKITVNAVNDAPIASNDEYAMDEDTQLVIDPAGVLANDTDVEGDSLAATIVAGPANGSVVLNSDGSFTYTPNANFAGIDSFTYTAGDGVAESEIATVKITVNDLVEPPVEINVRPTAVNDRYTAVSGTTLQIEGAGVLANDTDAAGTTLSASLFRGPLHGSLSLDAGGSFSYTPNEGFSGRDSFVYRASDGELLSALAAVTIYVTPAPAPAVTGPEYTCEVTPPPVCTPPASEAPENCGRTQYAVRLAVIRERVMDALVAARTLRNSNADCVDALMSRGCWWR